jgi:hypothetical protein
MPLFGAFVGGFYTALSPVMAADTAINLFTETREVPGSAKQTWMYGTPGLLLDATVPTLGCRGWFAQDGRTWVVCGDTIYERTAAATYVARGTVPDDGKPVSFASNGAGGDQLAVVGGGELNVLDLSTNAVTTATLPFSNPVMITFIDGYGIINERDTPKMWFSALEDFTSWDALDFFARSGTSDNVIGITVSRDRVWALGSKSSTLFYNSGDADTPFIPYPGTAFQTGLVSPWLLWVQNDVLYWVAESGDGERRIVRASEPSADTISTPPIALFLERCTTLTDARMLGYEQAGHPFVIVTCPSSPDDVQTYAYDVRENLWHARAGWDSGSGTYTRWRAAGSTVTGGQVFVGDWENGNVYTLDLDTFTDNGTAIRRERATPYLSDDNQVVFVDQFELGMQAGVGLTTGQGSDPTVNLEVSRDGARTWIDAGTAGLGAIGDYGTRAIWRQLGRSRADRLVFRVTQTDGVRTVWGPGAWLRLSAGTGQL